MSLPLENFFEFDSFDSSLSMNSLVELYSRKKLHSIDSIPLTSPFEHTMSYSLSEYVAQKLPVSVINEVILNKGKFEVHGLFPEHALEILANLYPHDEFVEVSFHRSSISHPHKLIRPRFFCSSNRNLFIVCVTPGYDYEAHYGTLLRHYLTERSKHCTLRVVHYPTAASSLSCWSGLDARFVKPNDIVVIGYSEEMRQLLIANCGLRLQVHSCVKNPYYESQRYLLPNRKVVNFLGVKYSFWGENSKILVAGICSLNPSEVIYVGKLGSLTSCASIYNDVFIPSHYHLLRSDGRSVEVSNISSGILSIFPELSTGVHVSLPTIIEETITQRKIFHSLKANSIDHEITPMTQAVSEANAFRKYPIKFSALHFASDYLPDSFDFNVQAPYKLANKHDSEAVILKKIVLRKMAFVLKKYFESS